MRLHLRLWCDRVMSFLVGLLFDARAQQMEYEYYVRLHDRRHVSWSIYR